MKLYEFQGKRIFKEYGIPVPNGNLVTSPGETSNIGLPAVLKAQVLVGGRGKAGGIKICDTASELSEALKVIFEMNLKGEQVHAVLAEEKSDILREFYISITFKGSNATPILMFSSTGGVDIEKVARENPEKIICLPLNPFIGPTEYQARYISKAVDYKDVAELKTLIGNLYSVFKNSDATLVEINPLAVTPKGLMALDSKILLDDKSKFRQENLFSKLVEEQNALVAEEKEPREDTITYVLLNGYIGLISDGAGTGMLTLDLIKDAGGEAANFCEMGGITNPQVMYNALCEVLKNPDVKSLLIILIGGFNRMDEMAEGIIKYKEDHGLKVPVIIRMCGTMEEVGKEMMNKSGIPTYDNLLEAVNEAVVLAGGR